RRLAHAVPLVMVTPGAYALPLQGAGCRGEAPGGRGARRSHEVASEPGPRRAAQAGRMTRAPHDPRARRPRGRGGAWVAGPQGRVWGRLGAAGLLLAHPDGGVRLQLRAAWSHLGGTWGIPGGGRRDEHETAREGALREAEEEAGVGP